MTPTQGEHAQTEALFYASALENCAEVDFDRIFVPAAAVIRRLHAQVAALTAPPAQPAAPQCVAYAELDDAFESWLEDQDVDRLSDGYESWLNSVRSCWDSALRASHGQAPAGAADEMEINRPFEDPAPPFNQWRGEMQSALKRAGVYAARSPGAGNKLTLRWRTTREDVLPTPTAQAAPAAGITVEQVEDAIGLQSTAWDTIGAEKIVEAVLRLANARAPAAGAVAEQWRPMETAPKDGTLVRLLVEFEDGATEDGEGPHPTIGSNTWDNHHDFDEWQFAGWNWTHDCFTQGAGKPVGWLPMLAAVPTPAAQADSQPAPVAAHVVADALADSQYLAGVSAGWNAANADDPNAALQKLHESRAGYLKPLSAARDPADSVLEDAARLEFEMQHGSAIDAARKQGAKHDNT